MRSRVSRVLAAMVCATFGAGCLAAPPPPQNAAPYADAGYGSGDDFARGEHDGRRDARRHPPVGYFCAGVAVGILLPLAVVAAAKGDGNCSGGDCSGGGCGTTSGDVDLPPGAYSAPSAYADGYRRGYDEQRRRSQDGAVIVGFFTGLAIFGAGAAYYYYDPYNREKTQDTFSNPVTSDGQHRPPGIVLLRF